jgi:hypothetical protein
MARCGDCLKEVSFLLLGTHPSNGKNIWSPALERIEHEITEVDDGYIVASRFVYHDCQEGRARIAREKAEQEARDIEKALELKEEQRAWAMAEDPEERYQRAMQNDCPRCKVGIGERCRNLLYPHKDKASPHEERFMRSGT